MSLEREHDRPEIITKHHRDKYSVQLSSGWELVLYSFYLASDDGWYLKIRLRKSVGKEYYSSTENCAINIDPSGDIYFNSKFEHKTKLL